MIKISIIIPVFNSSQKLRRCLDSVKRQTEQSYEVIIVDDGSTDDSAMIVKEYLSDKRFKYIFQNNKGVSSARNEGIDKSEGEWIAFLDSDDYYEDTFLEVLLREAIRDDADIISCCCQYEINGEKVTISFWNNDCIFSENSKDNSKKELYLELMDSQYKSKKHRITAIGVPWGKLYRSKLIKDNNHFDLQLNRLQDNIFNMYVFDKANKIKYINQPLYNYDTDHISNYNKKYNKNAHIYYDLVCKKRKDFLLSKGLFEDSTIKKYYNKEVINNTLAMLRTYFLNKNNPESRRNLINKMKALFSQELYEEAFNEEYGNIDKMHRKIRIFLLKNGKYNVLFFLYKFLT